MRRPSSMENLDIRIKELEYQYAEQMADIKLSASALVESVSPMHLLKSTFQKVATTPGIKGTILDTAVGLGAGYLGRKIFVNKSGNLFKRFAGTTLQMLLTNFVSKKLHQAREDNPSE